MNSPVLYRDHDLIGLPEQVKNVLRNHHEAGTLVSFTRPQPVAPGDRRVRCAIRVVDTSATQPQSRSVQARLLRQRKIDQVKRHITRRKVKVALVVAGVGAVVGVVAYVVYLIHLLVVFITEHAAIIVGALALALVILLVLWKLLGGGGGGNHCPGCPG